MFNSADASTGYTYFKLPDAFSIVLTNERGPSSQLEKSRWIFGHISFIVHVTVCDVLEHVSMAALPLPRRALIFARRFPRFLVLPLKKREDDRIASSKVDPAFISLNPLSIPALKAQHYEHSSSTHEG